MSEYKYPGSDKVPIENNSSPLTIFDSGQVSPNLLGEVEN